MKQILPLLLVFSPMFAFSQAIEATLLGHWGDDSLTPTSWLDSRYNDVWGVEINGKEYGIVGSTAGFHFIDLTIPENAVEVAFVPGVFQGSNLVHRDLKTYQHYLYGVADEGSASTLQIIDMNGLPNQVEEVYNSNEFVNRAHNIFIDEANAVLYAVGVHTSNIVLLSLANPEAPDFLASYSNGTTPSIPYVHDCYVRNNIGYLNCGNNGFYVVDFSDPANAVILGTMTDYPQQGYNHSGWLSDDGQSYFLCDETHGMDIKVVDVSDFTDMNVVATMNAESTPNQIPHNVMVQGDLLFASYYYDGLQVFDISNPAVPRRIAYYDTFEPPNDNFFQGAWGVFVLPSGRSLLSDMNNGLFIFDVIEVSPNFSIIPSATQLVVCLAGSTVFTLSIGADFAQSGVTLSVEGVPAGGIVEFSENPASPGTEVEVTLSNITDGAPFTLTFLASDAVNQGEVSIGFAVSEPPSAVNLAKPSDGETDVNLQPLFIFIGGAGADERILEISTDSLDFEANILFTQILSGTTSFHLTNDLEPGTTFFWRILGVNECGETASEIHHFTTEVLTAVKEIDGNVFRLFPNPAVDALNVIFENSLTKAVQVELISLSGRKLMTRQMASGANAFSLDVSYFPAGVYLLRMIGDENSVSRRVVIRR